MRTLSWSCCVGVALVVAGCSAQAKLKADPRWGPELRDLGPVTAGVDQQSIGALLCEEIIKDALRAKTSESFGVPAGSVVLGEIEVKTWVTGLGLLRAWQATAHAGVDPKVAVPKPPKVVGS